MDWPAAQKTFKKKALTCGASEPARKEAGRKVYNARCYFCHGYRGDADTAAARYLDPSPRNFTLAFDLTREDMRLAIRDGQPKTAMQAFRDILSAEEINAVITFIEEEFVRCHGINTRYHTAANGWPDHTKRYAAAIPFVAGTIAVDTASDQLEPAQRTGLALFRRSCIICHEGHKGPSETELHEPPEESTTDENHEHIDHHRDADDHEYDRAYASTEKTIHDRVPVLAELTPLEKTGGRLYQESCALCHAADGTGKNWIGYFLRPHPPDLTSPEIAAGLDDGRLRRAIIAGVPNSSMPGFGAALSQDQVTAIVAYLRRAFLH